LKTGARHSPETRAKMAATAKGRIKSPEHRANLAAAGRADHAAHPRVLSAEHRTKIGAASKGVPLSAEHRAHISAGLTGTKRPHSAEWSARVSATKTGKPHLISPEGRARINEGVQRARDRGVPMGGPASRHYTTLAQALHEHLSAGGLTLEPEIRFGRFTVDLYDREHHIAYEADGMRWHDLQEARRPGCSARRDAYLIQYFELKVVHFTDKEITALTGWPKKRKATA
jgi:NUMOD3 motif-containing protein